MKRPNPQSTRPFFRRTIPGIVGSFSLVSSFLIASCTPPQTTTDTPVDNGSVTQTNPDPVPSPGLSNPSSPNPDLSNALDQEFAVQAAQSSLLEIEAGQLAADQATNEAVRQYGQMMIADHTRANQQLQQVATAKNIVLPTELAPEYQTIVDQMAGLSGEEFDRAYTTEMVNSHQQAIALFENQIAQGTDQDLTAWATQTLPALQEHLSMAENLSQQVGN